MSKRREIKNVQTAENACLWETFLLRNSQKRKNWANTNDCKVMFLTKFNFKMQWIQELQFYNTKEQTVKLSLWNFSIEILRGDLLGRLVITVAKKPTCNYSGLNKNPIH